MFTLICNGTEKDMELCYIDYLRNHNYDTDNPWAKAMVNEFNSYSVSIRHDILAQIGVEFV